MSNLTYEQARETRFLRMPRPLAGALIGIFLFLLIVLPRHLLEKQIIVLSFVLLDVELLGRLTVSALSTFAKMEFLANGNVTISTLISLIPPGILGWLIGSYQKPVRIAGIILAVMYLSFILVIGTLPTLKAI